MKLFVDTADTDQIRKVLTFCSLDGVTTNPSLIAKSGKNHHSVIKEICLMVKGPVSAEVVSTTPKAMEQEALKLASLHPQVVVKLPLTKEGLALTHRLSTRQPPSQRVQTNLTLCFSPLQALMAARAGASIVSVFVGRSDDIGMRGMSVVSGVVDRFSYYGLKTKVLVASVRTLSHVQEAFQAGADIATLPPSLFEKLIAHPLTTQGLKQFLDDHRSAQKPPPGKLKKQK